MENYSSSHLVDAKAGAQRAPNAVQDQMHWYSIITSPAGYFIINRLRSRDSHSYSVFKSIVPAEFHEVLKKILSHLEATSILKLEKDTITVLNREFLFNNDEQNLARFLPQQNEWTTRLAIRKFAEKKPNNLIRYYTIDKNKETQAKVKEILQRASAEIQALAAKSYSPSENPVDEAQYVCLLSAEISMEDLE